MSINSKKITFMIIGFGLVSSVAALLMIVEFVGLKPEYQKVFEISSQAYASVTDSLTGIAQAVAEKLASI